MVPQHLRQLLPHVRNGTICGVVVSAPCCTFAQARRAEIGSRWPGALRTVEIVLSAEQQAAVDLDR